MPADKKFSMSNRQKAAVLMVFLGPEVSAEVFKHMTEEEIEAITLEIARLKNVTPEMRDGVVSEFHEMLKAREFVATGGIQYANEVLERALGREKAMNILSKLTAAFKVRPFDMVRNTDPVQLLNFIQTEHPQTIALIMAHLQPGQASSILGNLPESIQAEVAKRLALMDRTSPEVIREVERVLEKKLSMVASEDYTAVGGVDSIVAILNLVDRGTEKSIMENLEIQNPELAEEIKRKMFVFEDIGALDDRSMQRVLKEVDNKALSVALKGTTEVLREKFFKNMSKRAATMLREEMEYMGPVRGKDVDVSQQSIVNIIRDLEERGEVFLSRGGEEEFVR